MYVFLLLGLSYQLQLIIQSEVMEMSEQPTIHYVFPFCVFFFIHFLCYLNFILIIPIVWASFFLLICTLAIKLQFSTWLHLIRDGIYCFDKEKWKIVMLLPFKNCGLIDKLLSVIFVSNAQYFEFFFVFAQIQRNGFCVWNAFFFCVFFYFDNIIIQFVSVFIILFIPIFIYKLTPNVRSS